MATASAAVLVLWESKVIAAAETVAACGRSSGAILRKWKGCRETARSAGHMRKAGIHEVSPRRLVFRSAVIVGRATVAVAWPAAHRKATAQSAIPQTGMAAQHTAAAFALPAATSSRTWSLVVQASRGRDGKDCEGAGSVKSTSREVRLLVGDVARHQMAVHGADVVVEISLEGSRGRRVVSGILRRWWRRE